MRQIAKILTIVGVLGMVGSAPISLAQSSVLQLVFRVPGGIPIRSSPVIDIAENAIYFGADDGNLYALPLISTEGPRLPKWIFSPDSDLTKRRPLRVAPVIDEVRNRIYVGTDNGMLYAVNRETGENAQEFTPNKRPAPIRVSPVLDQSRGVLYVAADDRQLLSLNSSDGGLAGGNATFNRAKGAIRAVPVIDFVTSGIYFGSDDGKFYAIDREDFGTDVFTPVVANSPIRGSPLLDILGSEAAIYFGADNGSFHAIDRTGKDLYTFETQGPIRTMAAVDPVKNAVYFVSDDGKLYALYRLDEKGTKGEVVRRQGAKRFSFNVVTDGNPNPLDGDLPRSSPVIDRRLGATGTGTIIVGSVDGNLYGIDPDSGRLRFIHAVPSAGSDPRAAIRTTPALYVRGPGSFLDIYVGTDDGGLYLITRRP